MNLTDDNSVDLSPNLAVDADKPARFLRHDRHGNGEGCLFNNLFPEQKYLWQDKHNDEYGNKRTAPKTLSDTRDCRFGSHLSDQNAGNCQHGARCNDRRKSKIHRFDDRIFFVHLLLQLHEPPGNNDCIINIGAHLNRTDDQIAHKEKIGLHQSREREIYPDTSLNDDNQQYRHSGRFESKKKYRQTRQNGYHIDHRIISGKSLTEIILAGRLSDNENRTFLIIFTGYFVHFIQKSKCLIAFLRQVQIDEHTAVLLALQLFFGNIHLLISAFQRIHQIVFQRDITFLHLFIQEHDHINEGYAVCGNTTHQLGIVLIVDRIGHVEQFRHFIVQFQKFGELPCRQLIRQHIAVHRLRIG